jgi:hypothetical protein
VWQPGGSDRSHRPSHESNEATGIFRCNFCDFTVMILEELSEHIGLHFQLPESYCSNVWRFPFSSPYASSIADDDDGSRTPFAHQSAKSIHGHARITYRFFLFIYFLS